MKARLAFLASFILICMFAQNSLASEFRLSVAENSSEQEFERVLGLEREHRKSHIDDSIVIDLPKNLNWRRTVKLGSADSGTDKAPLILRGAADGGSDISGALNASSLQVIGESDPIYSRIPADIRTRIRRVKVDLPKISNATAFAPHGSFTPGNPGQLFVFEDNQRLRPARWPSQDYQTPANLPRSIGLVSKLILPDNAPDLKEEANLWITGAWGWSWWIETERITTEGGREISFPTPVAPFRASAEYYIYNIASGLEAGRYYYSSDGYVYFLPRENNKQGKISISAANTLINVSGAKNIILERISLRQTIREAIRVENSHNVIIQDCFIGQTGTQGIILAGGTENQIRKCIVDDTGYEGVAMSGGDLNTLAPAKNAIIGTRISRPGQEQSSYRAAVNLGGVGLSVEDCEIFNAPHAGIIFSGNDHIIAGNVLHDVVLSTADAGAIYSARSWTSRGTVIASNLIQDVTNRRDESNVRGVYLDDQLSGIIVYANIFKNVDEPILVGGGRDNIIEENLSIWSKTASIRVDGRGLTWQAAMAQEGGILRQALKKIAFQAPPYSVRYPALPKILDNAPGSPLDNRIAHNIADMAPVVTYDAPASARLGIDTDNIVVPFSGNIDYLLSEEGGSTYSAPELKKTVNRTNDTLKQIKTLFFATVLQ